MIIKKMQKIKRHHKFSLTTVEWIMFLLIYLSFLFSAIAHVNIYIDISWTKENLINLIVALIVFLIINIVTYYLFTRISDKNKEKLKDSLLEFKLASYEQSLVDVKSSYEEIRKLRHDMNYCIQCIYTLLHNNKVEEAKQYISQLISEKLMISNSLVATKSEAFNAVMNLKLHKCKSNNINMKYEITGSVEKIRELDLTILLANLLDNAIEACMKLESNRNINLKIFNEKNYLVILINNNISGSVLKKNSLLKTTKKDKLSHGFGISSIKDIVKAYNGMIKVYEEKKQFYVDIWLNLGEV